jgi:hypothetical protein
VLVRAVGVRCSGWNGRHSERYVKEGARRRRRCETRTAVGGWACGEGGQWCGTVTPHVARNAPPGDHLNSTLPLPWVSAPKLKSFRMALPAAAAAAASPCSAPPSPHPHPHHMPAVLR